MSCPKINLKFLPDTIGNLKALEVFQLVNVEYLDLFPKTFWNLESLKKLSIYGRNIIKIDESIQNLKNIESIHF